MASTHPQPAVPDVTAHWLSKDGQWVSARFALNQSWRTVGSKTVVDVRALIDFHVAFTSYTEEEKSLACMCVALTRQGVALSIGEASHLMFLNRCEDNAAAHPFRLFHGHPGSKRRYGRFHRRMKTMAERRLVAGRLKEEDEPVWRGRRRNLPNSWDDFVIGSLGVRSWKKHRKTQWKDDR